MCRSPRTHHLKKYLIVTPCSYLTKHIGSRINLSNRIRKFFILDMFIQIFCFYFDRLEIILGGEGGYLDWFLIRLLARDPPSEVGSMQR